MIGAVIGGLLARAYGLTTAFIAGATLMVVVSVAAMPVITERALREARNRAAPAEATAVP